MAGRSISTTQLARICGVSQGTVDRALNDRPGIRPETKEKILAVAKEYGYRPNIHARSIRGGKSMLIGVVVFHLYNQYFPEMVTAIEGACADRGYATVIMLTDKDPQRELTCIGDLYRMGVDGIVLCPVNSGEAFENYLLSLKIPVVTIGNHLEKLPHVGIDDRAAMSEMTRRALDASYDHLVYVCPSHMQGNATAQRERLQGFLDVAQQQNSSYCLCHAAEAEQALHPDCKNVLLCPSDHYGLQLLPLVLRTGAGIISMDNQQLLDRLHLRMDSVAYDQALAAKWILGYIADGTPIPGVIPHTYIRRNSL